MVFAGIIAFSTGAIDRRSQHNRFHYQEMKTLYAEALRIGRDLEILEGASARYPKGSPHGKSRSDR